MSGGDDQRTARWCIAPRTAPYNLFERSEERWVELTTDVATHDLHRFVVRERLLVAALRRERVVDVGDAKHARGERDRFTLELVWIALAIPALMVAFNDRPYIPREVDVGKKLDTR
jgi:hypothetical protein